MKIIKIIIEEKKIQKIGNNPENIPLEETFSLEKKLLKKFNELDLKRIELEIYY